MAAYLVETPNGKRIIEAANAAAATNFVIRDEVKTTNLNVSELSKLIREGMTIETIPEKQAEKQAAAK